MSTIDQAAALVWLRFTLWKRRLAGQGAAVRLVVLGAVGLAGLAASAAASALVLTRARGIPCDLHGIPRNLPAARAALEGWLTLALFARLYLVLVARGASGPLLEPRTFLPYAVPGALVSAINFAAHLLEPGWLLLYPPLFALALAAQRLHTAPLWAMALSEGALVLAIAALFQLGAALLAASGDRRLLAGAVALLFALGLALGASGLARTAAQGARTAMAGSPRTIWSGAIGGAVRWPARLAISGAQALGAGQSGAALWQLALLLATALLCLRATAAIALREARRPEQTGRAGAARGVSGWVLPLLPDPLSALIEKEAKTLLRAGWMQLLLAPILFFVLRFSQRGGIASPLGAQPLLFVAAYAHLGVLAYAANGFGFDLAAARAWFLWPISARQAVAAKNAVAYAFSLLLFVAMTVTLSLVAPAQGPSREQVLVGLLAHAATFPVLAGLGNVLSVLAPSPMRGLRLRRSGPGAAVAGVRLATLFAVGAAAWAPYAIARLTGLPVLAAYAGELIAMAPVYGGLLQVSARLLESRRETLLRALAHDE